ncbi:hypothetical protein [Schinkia azotoformans]|uniref:hypothetical protein n=1 Tax=Schinkia azotoformans TaxID=1454 RepID=UPI002DB8BBF3|nr:hypothetical protein [Schinkia azotoformans]MEC1759845.1 hypothetical protein [Schinkia azotoformans]
MNFHNLVVGQPLPLFNTIPKREGTSLNYLEDGSLCIVIRFDSFTTQERNEIKKGLIQFRYIQEEDKIFLLVRFGTLPPMELPFDPTIYLKQGLDFKVLSNSLSIYAVDHKTSKLVSFRTIGLHQDFIQHLCNNWYNNCSDGLRPTKIFRLQYQIWLDELYGSHSTNDLWRMATPIDWKSGQIEHAHNDSKKHQKLSRWSQYVLDKLPTDPRFEECLKEAKETKRDVKFASWLEPCDDPKEECSWDFVELMVSPLGEKKFERTHTW